YRSIVMADIPGLIEGAGEGAGLGHRFLRHIDRCRLIVHLVDAAETEDRSAREEYEKINAELAVYDPELAKRPQIIAANKIDAGIPEQLEVLREYADAHGYELYPISAATGEGIKELLAAIVRKLDELPPIKVYEPDIEPEEEFVPMKPIEVRKVGGVYELSGGGLEKAIGNTNFGDYESLQYFQTLLVDSGAIDMLERAGIQEDDTVRIGEYEFDYIK
ncbi:MAG: Obg family GTPase CgtA, partial [Clostridia bacterium]|nr:Obg family GTPase CgtA [Clostridia bacterium]